jgi:RNA polymerase sigma-70 factor, ECF subfamily
VSDLYDFDTLCTPHYRALIIYANRLLPGRSAEARDLVQEAYLKAFRWWPKWSPSTGEDPVHAARGWLHRIVQNVFLDQTRARTGHRKLLDEHHDSVVENTYGVDADHNIQVLSDGIGDEVRQALDSLDPDQRAVVVRADFEGEQYLTISEALGIPLGTVMSRLHRARKRLAGALKDYAKDSYGFSSKEIVVKTARKPKFAEGTRTDLKPVAPDAQALVAAEDDCLDVCGEDASISVAALVDEDTPGTFR